MEHSKRTENILLSIWVIAVIATVGSLYFSEIKGYAPCEFCWYQRILMYPLVIIYGIAAWMKNKMIALPGIFLSGIGMLVSTYHYLVQKLPALQETGSACGLVPCNTAYVNYFGFITIPFMAGTAFLLIFVLHLILWRNDKGR